MRYRGDRALTISGWFGRLSISDWLDQEFEDDPQTGLPPELLTRKLIQPGSIPESAGRLQPIQFPIGRNSPIGIRTFATFVVAQAAASQADQTRFTPSSMPVGRDSPVGRSLAQFALLQPVGDVVAQVRLLGVSMPPSTPQTDNPPLFSALTLVTMRMLSEPGRPGWVQQPSVPALFQVQQADAPMRSAAQIVLTQPAYVTPSSVRLPQTSILALLETQPAPEPLSGGASFPFSRPWRGTALFSTPQPVVPVEPPVTPVAKAAKVVARPEPAPGPLASGSTVLRHLAIRRPLPAGAVSAASAVDAALARLRVDILLVDMEALLLRLELAAMAAMQAQAEEADAIAMLMLLSD